jgi:hypothetical protein
VRFVKHIKSLFTHNTIVPSAIKICVVWYRMTRNGNAQYITSVSEEHTTTLSGGWNCFRKFFSLDAVDEAKERMRWKREDGVAKSADMKLHHALLLTVKLWRRKLLTYFETQLKLLSPQAVGIDNSWDGVHSTIKNRWCALEMWLLFLPTERSNWTWEVIKLWQFSLLNHCNYLRNCRPPPTPPTLRPLFIA